ncbi:type VII secretion system-associated protein [Nocardia amamiensis]|uniref:Type VII secretion system-associated protein n=1 Tax=Nocardia amamiensis TaxID=404578 RepID=A0ABS0CMQ0_9NOCA|nr:type VII secretion system-associated protein [Nocardia amamiensis]
MTLRRDDWVVLLGTEWESATPRSEPPLDIIVGGWMVDEEGKAGPFQPNPSYIPADEATPTDPVDTLLRRIAAGEPVGNQLVALIRNSVVEIGCDEQDQPVVDTAPDGVPCVLVATAEVQKLDVIADRWWPVLGSDLPAVVPPGIDILLNANGAAPFRLAADILRNEYRDL